MLACLLALAPAARLHAQDSLPPRPEPVIVVSDSVVRDTAGAEPLGVRPVSPGGALLRSIILPGWGQAKLGRKLPAVFFLAVEGVSLGMVLKTNCELPVPACASDPGAASTKTREREDWLVIMAVNHLISGARGLRLRPPLGLPRRPGAQARARRRRRRSVSFPVRVP